MYGVLLDHSDSLMSEAILLLPSGRVVSVIYPVGNVPIYGRRDPPDNASHALPREEAVARARESLLSGNAVLERARARELLLSDHSRSSGLEGGSSGSEGETAADVVDKAQQPASDVVNEAQ